MYILLRTVYFRLQHMKMWFRSKNCIGTVRSQEGSLWESMGLDVSLQDRLSGQHRILPELRTGMIFSLLPPKDTMLDALVKAGYDTYGVGKIYDIFLQDKESSIHSVSRIMWTEWKTIETQDVDFNGICFVNLVDFDMVYGHRNNRKGYAEAATTFDRQLGTFMERMR